jgi:ribosomal protein S12 methylthiotransferase accessory factor
MSLETPVAGGRLEFSAYVVPVAVAGEHLLLLTEDRAEVLEGKIYCDVANAISGGLEWEEIGNELGQCYSREQLEEAIAVLTEHGLLCGGPAAESAGQQAYWESLGVARPERSISTKLICDSGRSILVRALQANGLKISEDGELLIVTTDDYLRPELAAVNNEKRPWLLAKPVGHTIFIGPLFVPGKTACWACLAHWIRTNRWQQAAFLGWDEKDFPFQPSVPALPGTLALAAGMIATAAAVWAARGSHEALEGRIIAVDTRTFRQAAHPVRRRTQCPVCGGGPAPVWQRDLYELVSPLTGVVSEIQVTDQPAGGFFHARGRFVLPLPVPGSRALIKPGVAAGKGATKREAEIGCIAESVERYSATHRGTEPYVRMRLDARTAISPERILLFSERQCRHRGQWNKVWGEEQWIPEAWSPEMPILWTPARSLADGRAYLVPAGCTYLWYPFTGEPHYAMPDSNGCASGKDLEEAALHGLLELIERDSVAIWWYNRLHRPGVDLESFGHPVLTGARGAFAALGRDLYLLDLTSDLGIPVYAALAPKRDRSEPFFGCAAHVSPAIAASKAIAELAQIWFWHTHGEPDEEIEKWIGSATLSSQCYLQQDGEICVPPDEHFASAADALRHCVNRVMGAGIEPLAVDLTRSDIGVPAVRVIAPGLRHFRSRFGPGRLFEVPAKMGWLPKARAEEELNPVPCFL